MYENGIATLSSLMFGSFFCSSVMSWFLLLYSQVLLDMVIQLLPSELQVRLRSGVAITSFTQCVEELVLNALDAASSCIAVRVDVPLGKIQVVDNGNGITREELSLVANRYKLFISCHVLYQVSFIFLSFSLLTLDVNCLHQLKLISPGQAGIGLAKKWKSIHSKPEM